MKSLLVIASVLAVWPFGSGKTYHMTASSAVPGAEGTVGVKNDKDNGNFRLDIKVEHLARPNSLTPPENLYIVWVQPKDGSAEKEGVLRVNGGLKGKLEATTTSTDFDVSITAEQSDSANQPSRMQVLHAHVSP
jgi:hypothetical protein